MDRLKSGLVRIYAAILLAGCNSTSNAIVPSATKEALDQALTVSPQTSPAMPSETDPSETPELDEPNFELLEPTPEPPGEIVPAQKRMQAGDALVIQQIVMIDANTGWAIGGEAGRKDSVFHSVDGGFGWKEVSPPEAIDGGEPLMAVGDFIDGSTAWIVYHLEADARQRTRYPLRVWRTSDAGQHWQSSSPVSVEFVGATHSPAWVDFTDQEQGWVLARYGGAGMQRYPVYLLRSSDAGAYWEILEDPYEGMWLQSCPKTGWDWHPSGAGVLTLGLCPFESAEIRLSTDAGRTWKSIRLPFPPGEEERFGFTSCEAHSPIFLSEQALMLASDCPLWDGDPQTVFLLYRTQDFGTTWQIQEYPGGMLYPVGLDGIFALGRDLYYSGDAGLTWTLIKQVAWDGQFSFVDPQKGWAVARDKDEIAFVRTRDGGLSWQLIKPVLIP